MKFFLSKFNFLTKNQNILIFIVVLLAAFLRLYKIADYMTFLGDEGRDVLIVYNILHGHLTLLGPTSSVGGFFLGPIYYYFMAPFLFLFNYDPVGPAVMVALFGVATVWLIYKFSSDLFNVKIGLIAALFYAISPLVINYSRSSWNPNPLPFFSLLALYTLYKATDKNNLKLFFASGILLGIAMQLHYLAIFLGIIMFFYILLAQFTQKEKSNKFVSLFKQYCSTLFGFLIGWSLFLAFEIRHGFPDFINIFNFVIHSGNTGANVNFLATVYDVFFRIFGRLIFAFPQPDQFYKYDKFTINLWTDFILVIGVASTVLLIFNFYKSIKSANENIKKYLLLSLWFFVGILLFGFYKKSIYDYYFAFMFPLPFILVADLLLNLYKNVKSKMLGKIFAILIFFIILVPNILGIPFRYPANRQLNQMKSIADFVMTKTDTKPFNFAIISGSNSDFTYRYFFTLWNHPPVTIQYPGIDPKRKTVTDQLFVVCESLPCEPRGNSLWEIAGFGQAEISGHWKVSVVEIYKLIHYKGS